MRNQTFNIKYSTNPVRMSVPDSEAFEFFDQVKTVIMLNEEIDDSLKILSKLAINMNHHLPMDSGSGEFDLDTFKKEGNDYHITYIICDALFEREQRRRDIVFDIVGYFTHDDFGIVFYVSSLSFDL